MDLAVARSWLRASGVLTLNDNINTGASGLVLTGMGGITFTNAAGLTLRGGRGEADRRD